MKKSKSSLVNHQFPLFYACYLLKSIQTPNSKSTYIGSTPHPPRRIRQHNGELTQGAWKTKKRRPWVMQMIVHGFPSKLAALQFEWSWQHPDKSRHLRSEDGQPMFRKAARYLKENIQIVRAMLAQHPYNLWPLQVKLFTKECVKIWNDPALPKGIVHLAPLPVHLDVRIELEGVDGKAASAGSQRTGPICVQDVEFTTRINRKHQDLLRSGTPLTCSICKDDVVEYTTHSLEATLCPHSKCTAISHLRCLATCFLESSAGSTPIVPRGGKCPSCQMYVLWGDVVRAMYRRSQSLSPQKDSDDDDEDAEGELYSDDPGTPAKPPGQAPTSVKKNRFVLKPSESSSGEHFDFDESDTDDELPSVGKLLHWPPDGTGEALSRAMSEVSLYGREIIEISD